MDLGNTGHSTWTVNELEVTWPIDSSREDLYSIKYHNLKWIMMKEKITKKLLLPNSDHRFNIDGTMMGLENS
jgi:hypothetical protein